MKTKKSRAAVFSILANAALLTLKLFVAIITGSLGILAEFLHSSFDMLASLMAYYGIKKSEEPADKTHQYGHEKFENLSSFFQSVLIFITGIFVIFEAINRIYNPRQIESGLIGIIVMGISIVVVFLVSRYLHRMSRIHASPALEADAYHFTTDLWSSLSVIAGLVFAHFGFGVADPIAAIIVSVIMIALSVHLSRKAVDVLLDKSPSAHTIEKISTAMNGIADVRGYHNLKARYAGSKILASVNVHLSENVSIKKAHEISEMIEKNVKKTVPDVKEVIVHVEPDKHNKK